MKNLQSFEDFVNESLNEAMKFHKAGYTADNSFFGHEPSLKKAGKELAKFLGAKDLKGVKSLSTEDTPASDAEPGTVFDDFEKEFDSIRDFVAVHNELPEVSKEIPGGIYYSKKEKVLKLDDYGITVYFWKA